MNPTLTWLIRQNEAVHKARLRAGVRALKIERAADPRPEITPMLVYWRRHCQLPNAADHAATIAKLQMELDAMEIKEKQS